MKRVCRAHIRIVSIALVVVIIGALTGCGSDIEKITLSLWATEAKMSLVDRAMQDFQKIHADEVEIEWQVSKEAEDTCKETVLSNPEGAADIYAFADDQLDELKDAGALLKLDVNPEEALKPFGGSDSTAYESVVRDGAMYAYPESANGYFLYYHKKYFDKKDIRSLERIIQIAGNDNKKVTMDFSSGWYLYSFFQGAGMTLKLDDTGSKNICDWNRKDGTPTGKELAKALLGITTSRGFKSMTDDAFVEGVKNGSIIAGINGAWNADTVSACWGLDYGAAKLPTFMVGKKKVQMASFAGYKVVGINAYTKYPEWCRKFVEYFTSKEKQFIEFQETGEVPANQEVADMEEVQKAPAVKALTEQEQYASLQRVGGNYWNAASKFGVTIASGNPDKKDLQELLNKMVKGITK